MDRIFQLTAVVLAGTAAYLFWASAREAGFIVAVFGAVAYFLSIRLQAKRRIGNREAEHSRGESDADGNGQ